jgi:ribose transport system substrate-binding protein
MNRKSLAILVVIATFLAACGTTSTVATNAQAKSIKIGMSSYTLCCSYFIGMDKAVKDGASAYSNITVYSTDGGGDAAKLNSDIEDLIAKKVDGMIISGGPLEQLPSALDDLKKAGIPVVLVDRQWSGGYTSYVGPDNFIIGQQDGQFIVNKLGSKGGILAVIKGGPADNSIGLNRTKGMLDIVGKVTAIKVVTAPDFGNWSTDDGLKVMENLLAANPHIDAVFCENDSMCLGAQRAIADAGRTAEMFLCAVDGQKEALQQIMNGSNYGCTGRNDSDQIGHQGFYRLMSILAGGTPPLNTILPSPLITIENAVKYYDPNSLF